MKDFDFIPEPAINALEGTVAIPRQLSELKVWRRKPFTAGQAAVDLYLLANNDSGEYKLTGGQLVPYKPGWILWSNKGLAERWGWRREDAERFLAEMEAAEVITRQSIGQSRKVIILTDFGHPMDTRRAAGGHQTGTKTAQTETETETEERETDAPPTNRVDLELAFRYFRQNGSDYSEAEVRAAWMTFEATAEDGWWMFGRRRVGDWRAALESRMYAERQFQQKNGPDRNGVKGQDTLRRERGEILQEIELARSEKNGARLAELERELRA